jgi:hypothetical protein
MKFKKIGEKFLRLFRRMTRFFYRAFWWMVLDHNAEWVWLHVEKLSWMTEPPSASELKEWRRRAERFNLVYHNMKRSSTATRRRARDV